MSSVNFSSYVIRVDGKVDLEATKVKFADDLAVFVATEQVASEEIANAVTRFFDSNLGVKINLPDLAASVWNIMGAPGKASEQFKKITDYVRSVAGERGEAVYGIVKGKDGGSTRRWVDVPEDTLKAAAKKSKA